MAETPATGTIPALAASGLGLISAGGFLDPPPGTGHGPIKQHPAHPFHGNLDGPGQVTPTIGNIDDPVLKPWAAAQMQASNEEVLSGQRGLPFSAQGRCYPGGVPGQLLYPIEPMYFIQTKEHVVERYKVSADGNMLEASVTVEDPDAFNAPLHMIKRWRKAANPGLETVCAENNGDHFSRNLFPIPEAKTPDF